jgi:hypothetical protein
MAACLLCRGTVGFLLNDPIRPALRIAPVFYGIFSADKDATP